jgi:hypothetical protein
LIMGFKISWDVPSIIRDLRRCSAEASSAYNDGFSAWMCKQDLLQIKYELDNMLRSTPYFGSDEDDFVRQLEKRQVWHELKK